MADKLLDEVVKAAYRAYTKDPGNLDAWRKILKDPESTGSMLLCAAKALLPEGCLLWEPEVLWLELDVPVENRDKLMAAMALATYPSFFWDARVFGSTALAFNDEVVFDRSMPHTSPEQLAWAAVEAEVIFAITEKTDFEPHYADEVAAYAAVMLFDAGWVLCPESLEFAEEQLDALLSKDGRELAAKVKAAWRAHSKENPADGDSALGVQLARQAGCEAYLDHRLEQLKASLP